MMTMMTIPHLAVYLYTISLEAVSSNAQSNLMIIMIIINLLMIMMMIMMMTKIEFAPEVLVFEVLGQIDLRFWLVDRYLVF